MADNSKYEMGMDWYEGNTVRSFTPLVGWNKMRFAYFRLGIGYDADDLTLLNRCHAETSWDLGGYYELGLPVVPKDSQLRVVLSQLDKAGDVLRLPVSLAFEVMGYTTRVPRQPLWPSVGDLKYLATALANKGRRVNIYTGLWGLDIIKASRLIDMTETDWWIARGYDFPLWSTEYPVDATLTYLQTKYGIQPDHVQFMQTVLDHGNSPIGGGQDFDRAVAWRFDAEPPVEPPTSELGHITVTVRSMSASLLNATADGNDVTGKTELVVVQPEQPPTPPVGEVDDSMTYGILRYQRIENNLTTTGKLTPAVVQLQDVPKPDGGKGAPIPLNNPTTWEYGRWLNDDRGYNYFKSIGAMWINTPYTDPLQAHAESLECQLNFVSWPKGRVKNGCAGLSCFQSDEDFKRHIADGVTWHTRPDIIWKAMAVNLDGSTWQRVRGDVDAYIPLMARATSKNGTGELWLDLREIEVFPALPQVVTALPAYLGQATSLMVREDPDSTAAVVGKLSPGDQAIILEYRPRGASVWGRVATGWICLLYAPRGTVREFLTSWKLETPGVIAPDA